MLKIKSSQICFYTIQLLLLKNYTKILFPLDRFPFYGYTNTFFNVINKILLMQIFYIVYRCNIIFLLANIKWFIKKIQWWLSAICWQYPCSFWIEKVSLWKMVYCTMPFQNHCTLAAHIHISLIYEVPDKVQNPSCLWYQLWHCLSCFTQHVYDWQKLFRSHWLPL